MLKIVTLLIGIFLILFFLWGFITSVYEKEQRAQIIFVILGCILPVPFFILALSSYPGIGMIQMGVVGTFLLIVIILILPIKPSGYPTRSIPKAGEDERDTMFSRKDLIPGSDSYNDYYQRNPLVKEKDDSFRKYPGLLQDGAYFYNAVGFAAADASFNTVEQLHTLVSGVKERPKIDLSSETITRFIKNWGKKLGALDVGVTRSREYHFYTVGGRRERYGKPVKNKHTYAIVFTVEMDYFMMGSAPYAPTVMESAQQYLSSGTIAVQVAELIRNLGYAARAHIDANYELICPTIARDAGLGEIGRMGLLMTPRLGPRVRISAVTTDLPLIIDNPSHCPDLLYFCDHCKKCAEACPAKAIPIGSRKTVKGSTRWKIDSESCYTYWTKAGTDCGKCVYVCPFSHPDNPFHLLIRKGIRNSIIFSRIALKLDNLFYGIKSHRKKIPDWIPSVSREE